MKTIHIQLALVAILGVAALAALAGHPIIAPDMLAGLGMIPVAIGNTEQITEIKNLIVAQDDALKAWQKKHDSRIDALEETAKFTEQFIAQQTAPVSGTSKSETVGDKPGQFFDIKTKQAVPVLSHSHSMVALEQKTDTPSIGRLLRGMVLGGRADDANELADERKSLGIGSDPAGGYTVSGALSAQWIDSLRAQSVLSRAGCRTIPMPTGSLSLARVVDDPTISWHAENETLGTGDPTFGLVTLNAKTCVCLVRLSLELSQDSANIEQILQSTINAAMANAIDSAGLVGTATDTAKAPGGVMNLSGRNTVTSIGAPTSWDFVVDGMYELMLDNVAAESIGGMVAHPAVWKKMRKLKTGITNDNTPLTMPAEVSALPKYWTTAAPLTGGTTAKAIIGDWRDLIMGVRKDINVRILSEAFMGSNLQVAVLAYSRVDFAATRHQSFCTLEDITV